MVQNCGGGFLFAGGPIVSVELPVIVGGFGFFWCVTVGLCCGFEVLAGFCHPDPVGKSVLLRPSGQELPFLPTQHHYYYFGATSATLALLL